MLDWILNNKDWLFSGLGLVVLAGLGRLGWVIFSRRRLKVQPIPSPSNSDPNKPFALSLTLKELFKGIKSLPPYQRHDMRQAYIGTRFRLEGVLASISKKSDGDKIFVAVVDKGVRSRPGVYFDVSVSDYPQLRFIREGARMIVEGRITEVNEDIHALQLEDVGLEFPPK